MEKYALLLKRMSLKVQVTLHVTCPIENGLLAKQNYLINKREDIVVSLFEKCLILTIPSIVSAIEIHF